MLFEETDCYGEPTKRGSVGDDAWLDSSIAQAVKGSKKRERIFVPKKKRFGTVFTLSLIHI